MISSGIYDSGDTASSVYSAASHSQSDALSVTSSASSGIKRRTKKGNIIKKRLRKLFRNNRAYTRSTGTPQFLEGKEKMTALVPSIPDFQTPRSAAALSSAHSRKDVTSRQSACMLRSDRKEIKEGNYGVVNWNDAVFAHQQVPSTSENALIKVENSTKHRTCPTRPFTWCNTTTTANLEGCFLVIVMLVLFNLSCEIRFKEP